MTAIVGIINRQGVAFAADSAATVTLSSTQKISNHANKIFELSRREPVGIALCGNMDFMKIPWEQIIKMYRKQLSDRQFPSVIEYANDFFAFVRKINAFQNKELDPKAEISFFVDSFYNDMFSSANEQLKKAREDATDEILVQVMFEKIVSCGNDYKSEEVSPDFQDMTLGEFEMLAEDYVSKKISVCLSLPNTPSAFKDSFIETLFYILRSKYHVYSNSTGLVFFGYGDQELLPSYYSFRISEMFGERMKITRDSFYKVDTQHDACVEPFAQTDVAQTVVRGIDDKLRQTFYNNMKTILSKLVGMIVGKMQEVNAPKEFVDAMKAIDVDGLAGAFKTDMEQYIWDNYCSKLIDVVKFMSKEDMAEMAESLVKMTGLKRRITTEKESVGGPVDVAVITKGDGFVWIKRKHYFSADINHNYFERNKK